MHPSGAIIFFVFFNSLLKNWENYMKTLILISVSIFQIAGIPINVPSKGLLIK